MRKKLDTRFPAARIKKIMQADEDVGKIAMAVPLLVSKALELFLQDLCDRTYEITLKRGAKTLNSLHLKQCVQTFNVFDFLREIMNKVPDLGGAETGSEDRPITKRRKLAGDEGNESDDDLKKSRTIDVVHTSNSGRGRGRGRGRRGRPRTIDRDSTANVKFEDDPDTFQHDTMAQDLSGKDDGEGIDESKENVPVLKTELVPVRNFDLNVDLDENGDTKGISAPSISGVEAVSEGKHEEYPGWSLSDVEKMTINPLQLASLNRRIDEDEDYDEEG